MTTDIAKKQMCIFMRNGIEIWIDEDKAEQISADLIKSTVSMARIEGRILNFKDIVGIFNPQDLEELHRRNRGEWKCKFKNWHGKNDVCFCHENYRADKFKEEAETRRRIMDGELD